MAIAKLGHHMVWCVDLTRKAAFAMTDIILESVRAAVLLMILIFLYRSGRGRFHQLQKGWNLIILGFGLLLFGSLLDISDNFDALNPLIVVGDTEVEAFLEKFVGFLGGFVLLAIGLVLWIPGVQNMSLLIEERTRDLRSTIDQLNEEISERKRAEKAKQAFTAKVNHELRTPLTSIKGALGLIRSETISPLPEQTQALMDIAYRNSEHLETLINDILAMEKLETGKMPFHMAPVDIVDLVEYAIEISQKCAEQYGVTFVYKDSMQDAWAEGDRDKLLQVLTNLLSNAAKFSSGGGVVKVSTIVEDHFIRTIVHNQGASIAATVGDTIFEKFSQVDTSDHRKIGGAGLGLSIAKAIVEKHAGAIGYESDTETGTTFYFSVPRLAG